MSSLSYLPTILRETFGGRALERSPEPGLVMDSQDQVAGYEDATRQGIGPMAATYVFHAAKISQAVHGARRVIDLGCGPGTLLALAAELNPETSFLGLDLSEEMLASARDHVRARGLSNVEFARADMTALGEIADRYADGVISTMALHHLPDVEALGACFGEISRVLSKGGGMYLVDFARLKSRTSIDFLIAGSRGRQPEVFVNDYEMSLHAAFCAADFRRLAKGLSGFGVRVRSTFGLAVMISVTTPSRRLPPATVARLHQMRDALADRDRTDLDDLRFFFRLGRLGRDPFARRSPQGEA